MTSLAATALSAEPHHPLVAFFRRYKAVLFAFAASRLALLAVGLMTQIFIEPVSTHVSPLHFSGSAALRMWGQWDSGWYVSLANEGYSAHPNPDGQVNWVFFPAFPMLAALVAHLAHLPVFTVMVGLSNLSFLVALLLAHRLARETFDTRTADVAVALLCAVPGSYIFSSAYTESLFLLALTACLVLLRERRWLAAGACAGLASLTRNLGVGLILPFLLTAAPALWALLRRARTDGDASSNRRLIGETCRIAGGLAAPVLALAGFCAFLYLRTGDPIAFVTARKAWGRSLEFPLLRPLTPLVTRSLADGDVINFVAAWLSLAMVATLAALRQWSWFILALFLTLPPMASGLASYARYCLVVIPIFIAAARLLAPRPAATAATLIMFATLNGFLMVAWTLCMWVTV